MDVTARSVEAEDESQLSLKTREVPNKPCGKGDKEATPGGVRAASEGLRGEPVVGCFAHGLLEGWRQRWLTPAETDLPGSEIGSLREDPPYGLHGERRTALGPRAGRAMLAAHRAAVSQLHHEFLQPLHLKSQSGH